MARIDIRRAHGLSGDNARESADKVASELADSLGIEYYWEGGVLFFERPGVEGHIVVDDRQVHVRVHLGLLFSAFRGRIERELTGYLDRLFGSESPAAQ